MENEVCRVLYCSRVSKDRAAQDTITDLVDILLCSRRENQIYDITGVLVTDHKSFSQVIEGPANAVKNLVGRIACDQRHSGFRIISQQTSDTRLFQEWSMASISTGKGQDSLDFLFPTFSEQSGAAAIHFFCTSLRRHLLGTQML